MKNYRERSKNCASDCGMSKAQNDIFGNKLGLSIMLLRNTNYNKNTYNNLRTTYGNW